MDLILLSFHIFQSHRLPVHTCSMQSMVEAYKFQYIQDGSSRYIFLVHLNTHNRVLQEVYLLLIQYETTNLMYFLP